MASQDDQPPHAQSPDQGAAGSFDGTPGAQPSHPLLRCADGAACVEVTARIEAAHVARYVDHDEAAAAQLLAAASRWADAHNHGADADHEVAS